MNRKECYEFIKTYELQDRANQLAHRIYGDMPKINWTNLTTTKLEEFVNAYNTYKTPNVLTKNSKPSITGIDEGARKAILAIAKILNLKNIERNFN